MQLRELMTRDAEVVSPDASLQEAAQCMRDLDVGLIPICDGGRVIGMLTDRDITVRATAEGSNPKKTKVKEVMTEDVVSCYEDEDAADAARLMEDHQIRRLIILNRDDRLAGIVSLGDLATHTGTEHLAGEALEHVSQPGRSD